MLSVQPISPFFPLSLFPVPQGTYTWFAAVSNIWPGHPVMPFHPPPPTLTLFSYFQSTSLLTVLARGSCNVCPNPPHPLPLAQTPSSSKVLTWFTVSNIWPGDPVMSVPRNTSQLDVTLALNHPLAATQLALNLRTHVTAATQVLNHSPLAVLGFLARYLCTWGTRKVRAAGRLLHKQ